MPARRSFPSSYGHARRLRRTPTSEESRLWAFLRGNQLQGVSFRRQHAIGRYVVDFCSPKHRLVIELDGSAHLRRRAIDSDRTIALEKLGYRVLRFWDQQNMNDMDGVARVILKALNLLR
jgi:very-short-patch-repair endonuclease